MSSQHKALGRGIGALIPGAGASATPRSEPSLGASKLPIDEIAPNPDQPRRLFDPEHLERMASSIQRHGVLQPVVVRRGAAGYELVCGEQRWRAARLAGLTEIPAVVTDVDEADRLELALIENVQRADLNPIELAHAFAALGKTGATQEEIGQRVSLKRSTVANHLRLLDLPREFQTDVEEQRIALGHAKALLQVANPERRRQLRDRIVNDSLSVRAAEGIARQSSEPRKPRTPARSATDPDRQRVIDALRRKLQTRVQINGDDARGRIEIEYFGAEDLGRIVAVLLEQP
jgi:ParB family chromosome partitioning protein